MKKVFVLFFTWKIVLFFVVVFSLATIPLQPNFLGGGIREYLHSPYFWAWANFDGEHYLAIAREGYKPLTYFFFPLYPLLTALGAKIFVGGTLKYLLSGLVVANLSFLIGLFGLVKLIGIDYDKKTITLTLFLVLLFPTSFYFGSVYTEGLFFAFAIWSFYMARKEKWFWAGVLGGFATLTRVTGLALFPALVVEYFSVTKKMTLSKELLGTLIVPFGLFIYMYFLKIKTGDPLEFFHSLSLFGEQRSSSLVILPQVFYRYFFKILPNLNYSYFPLVFTTYLEIISAFLFFLLTVLSFWKVRLSYAIFASFAYIIPTLSGSFSSFPRYVLIIFPAFLVAASCLKDNFKIFKYVVYLSLFICLVIAATFFARGYWVS